MISKILQLLPGTDNTKARKLYRTLLEHHQQASCIICKSYLQYDCMIVKGSLLEHINDIAGYQINLKDLHKIQQVKLIEIEEITPRQHRIVFLEQLKVQTV